MRKYTEETSKQALEQVVTDIIDLDTKKDCQSLRSSETARRLLDGHYLDIERYPWDYIILVGYLGYLVSLDADTIAAKDVQRIRNNIQRIFKRPMEWMYVALSDGILLRYYEATRKEMPVASIDSVKFIRQAAKHWKVKEFNPIKYAKLLYVLNFLASECPFDSPSKKELDLEVIRYMLDLITTMKCPPWVVLRHLMALDMRVGSKQMWATRPIAEPEIEDLADVAEPREQEVQ